MNKVSLKHIFKQVCPPIFLNFLRLMKNKFSFRITRNPRRQDLGVYWDQKFADELESWGESNVWNEIKLLMLNLKGRVIDIGCGTGKVIEILTDKFPDIEVHGCDISDILIERALLKKIRRERLKVCDATKTEYADNYFDYAYSIGTLEHFTEEGIAGVVKECHRTVKGMSFHMIPVSRKGKDEGWWKTAQQSFFNNSTDWWLRKFQACYKKVYILDSSWNDTVSLGKWFVCVK